MALNGMDYALRLLSRRRYTTREIREKLRKKGFSDITSILERLKEWKYLDDEDYARSFITTRSRLNPRGKALMKLELRAKGIPSETVQKMLNESDISEYELAKKIVSKKIPSLKKYPQDKRRNRLFYLLKSRGFSQDVIYSVLKIPEDSSNL